MCSLIFSGAAVLKVWKQNWNVHFFVSFYSLKQTKKNSQTMKEEILCLTEIMDRKSICTDVSYKWRIIVYKHLEDLPDTGEVSGVGVGALLSLSGVGREVGWGGRLLTFPAFRMGGYWRWALIRCWALIWINTVSHQQPSYSGLCSPGQSNSTYLWYDPWVQTFHSITSR